VSYLAFVSRQREVHVAGWERHRLPGLVQDLAWGLLGVHPGGSVADRLNSLVPDDHHLGKPVYRDMIHTPNFTQWTSAYRLAMNYEEDFRPLVQYKGRAVSTWDLMLNTALAVGSGPMRLCARLAGQMGSHVWIDGPDRGFVADLITEGLVTDVFQMEIQVTDPSPVIPGKSVTKRHKAGWADVLELLREDDRGPVATYVSTMDDFPNSYELGIREADVWEDMENDQIWDLSELWLRNRHSGWQIKADGFDSWRFGHRLTVFDLRATDWEARLDLAIKDKRI
jgi:hypothetical protein